MQLHAMKVYSTYTLQDDHKDEPKIQLIPHACLPCENTHCIDFLPNTAERRHYDLQHF